MAVAAGEEELVPTCLVGPLSDLLEEVAHSLDRVDGPVLLVLEVQG